MAERALYLARTNGGDNLVKIPHSKLSWSTRRGQPDEVSASIPYYDPRLDKIDVIGATAPVKMTACAVENGIIAASGVIWAKPEYDFERRTLNISGQGIGTALNKRHIIPWKPTDVPLTIIGAEEEQEPNPDMRTAFVGKSWPFIFRSILQQMQQWPGSNWPFVFGSDGVGAHDKSYDAIDLKPIGEAFEDIRSMQNGVEYQFVPRFTADRLGMEYLVRVGDDADPLLHSPTVLRVDTTARQPVIRRLKSKESGANISSLSYGISGQNAGKILTSKAYEHLLIAAGYPLLEVANTSHSDVSRQATLDSYTAEDVRQGSKTYLSFTFQLSAESATFRPGTYSPGDYMVIKIGSGHIVQKGEYTVRIASVSYSGGKWADITVDEIQNNG